MCSIFCMEKLKYSMEEIERSFNLLTKRGPDGTKYMLCGEGILGFKRLAIMGLNPSGMQPFSYKEHKIVCNGEIYGFRKIKKELEKKYEFYSESDCEILIPLYMEYGVKMFGMLDAEFALVLYDGIKNTFIAARDPLGIRPLYYGETKNGGGKVFASEPRAILSFVDKVFPFPPGYYYDGGRFVKYMDLTSVSRYNGDSLEEVCPKIKSLLEEAVVKRLDADAPVGFLLSGGLDSSLVCAIAAKHSDKPLRTFAIGMETDAIDLKYAKEVADFLHTDHHEIIINTKDVLEALENVISILGTYDITTIRASIGMYLICKEIHRTTDIKVLLTGEISDELFGYKYTDYAPSASAFQEEAKKRIDEIHMYDVLRADRCISSNSLEARVPFGDLAFVDYVMKIDPALKLNTYNKGKYLLRHAFEDGYLPKNILYREKAAFSDAVGHSMVNDLKAYADAYYSDVEFVRSISRFNHAKPFTKEALLYRQIFEKYYPNQSQMVADFWMPNRSWQGCDVNDPSARVLANYKDSGK